jgi:alkanesulfonate monooxygenase SsuD/methylene tetrahydromethanopterin reductase-like flavin-dependent oxidoreductase (luciferase family)
MRLGLSLAPGLNGASTRTLDDTIQMAVAAEQAGIDTVYLSERHLDADAGYANVFAVAAAISAQVPHAWIGIRPMLGLDHPLRVVEQTNMLDVLTGGRCLIVLSDELDPKQYAAFGVSTPENGQLEDLVDRMTDAWSWQYQEDGPPLEFEAGAYSARMAGRVMPAPHRHPHPLLARETDSPDAVVDAACRGWAVQLLTADLEHVPVLISQYRGTLISAGHPESTLEECLRWLTVVVQMTSGAASDVSALLRELGNRGAAQVRLDLAPDVSFDDVLPALRSLAVRSA